MGQEVGKTYRPDPALIVKFLHQRPALSHLIDPTGIIFVLLGPVDQKQVQFIGLKLLAGSFKARKCLLTAEIRGPHLAAEEYLIPLNTVLFKSLSDALLIAVKACRIYIAVTRIQSIFNSLFTFSFSRKIRAVTHCRDHNAVVQHKFPALFGISGNIENAVQKMHVLQRKFLADMGFGAVSDAIIHLLQLKAVVGCSSHLLFVSYPLTPVIFDPYGKLQLTLLVIFHVGTNISLCAVNKQSVVPVRGIDAQSHARID